MLFPSMFFLAPQDSLTIENLKPNEVVRYPVISVRGKCGQTNLEVGLSKGTSTIVSVVNEQYIGLIELKPGLNVVQVKSGNSKITRRVTYQPMTTPYRVHAVWYVSSDEGSDYPYEKNGVKQRLNEKFDTILKMMQTFTAEAMESAGYGKKTFALDTDKAGKVIVTIVKSARTGDDLRNTNAERIWSEGYNQIKPLFDEKTQKYAALMAFSRWDAKKAKGVGATALGGGSLAMMYGGTVSLFPNSISEVQAAFSDTQFIDPAITYEDSASRKTRWANVSTAFGALLHELGHTFGLPHCADQFGIMSRGFDHFNRRFMLTEPPIFGQTSGVVYQKNEVSRWDNFHAAQLNVSPWFQPDGKQGKEFDRSSPPTIRVQGDSVIIESVRGLRTAGAEYDDKFPSFKEFSSNEAPKSITFSLSQLRLETKADNKIRITAIDTEGNRTNLEI